MEPMTAPRRLAALLATTVVVLAGCGADTEPRADDPGDQPTKTGKPQKLSLIHI